MRDCICVLLLIDFPISLCIRVWARHLAGRDSPQAVLLFNRNSEPTKIDIRWDNLGIYAFEAVHDPRLHRNLGALPTDYSTQVPAPGIVMLRVATPQ